MFFYRGILVYPFFQLLKINIRDESGDGDEGMERKGGKGRLKGEWGGGRGWKASNIKNERKGVW